MKTSGEIQADIKVLNVQIEEVNTQILQRQADIQALRTKAAAAFFEGKDVRGLSDDIVGAEADLRAVEHSRSALEEELSKALRELATFQEADKRARAKELHGLIREAADRLRDDLHLTLNSAHSYESLLSELRKLQLTPDAFRLAGPPPMIIERILNEALLYLDQSDPPTKDDEKSKYPLDLPAMQRTLIET